MKNLHSKNNSPQNELLGLKTDQCSIILSYMVDHIFNKLATDIADMLFVLEQLNHNVEKYNPETMDKLAHDVDEILLLNKKNIQSAIEGSVEQYIK